MLNDIRRRFKTLIPASVALAALASSAQATIIIDRFNPPPLQSVSTTAAAASFNNGSAVQDVDADDVIGTWRRLSILKTLGSAGAAFGYEAQVSVDPFYNTGVLNVSAGSGVRGKTLLQYTGNNAASSVTAGQFDKPGAGNYNLGNIDLTQTGSQVGIQFRGTSDRAFDMHFRIYKSDTEFAVATVSIPGDLDDSLDDYFIAFTDFVPTGASLQAILTAVNALQIELDNTSTSKVDMTMDFIQTYSVPEPTSLALMGGGIFALGLLRRRLAK